METDRASTLIEENQRLRRAVEELTILNEIALAISSTLSLEEILETIVNKCTKHLKAEQVAVLLLDEKREEKPFQTMVRGWDSAPDMMPYRLDAQLTGWMLKYRKPLLSNEFSQDRRFFAGSGEDLPIRSLICVPLIQAGRMIGLISVFNKKTPEGFSQEDLRLLSIIATQSAQVMENARLHKEEQAYISMQEELRMAYSIQTNLLPAHVPSLGGYDVFGISIPAREVGGDYFDYFTLENHRFAFCLGDVSGKGMPAALLMSNLQATVRGQSNVCTSASQCLNLCNTMLYHNSPPETFATFFYGIIDPDTHTVTYANAGHNYPFLFKKNDRTMQLSESGLVLGCMENFPYVETTIALSPGDMMVVFSDGITEALNPLGEEFGENRLLQLIQRNIKDDSKTTIEKIISGIREFSDGSPQSDDMTVVIIKRQNANK